MNQVYCVHKDGMLVPNYGIYCTEACFRQNKCCREFCGKVKRPPNNISLSCWISKCKISCQEHDIIHTQQCQDQSKLQQIKAILRDVECDLLATKYKLVTKIKTHICSICKNLVKIIFSIDSCNYCQQTICDSCQNYYSVWTHRKYGMASYYHVECWEKVYCRKVNRRKLKGMYNQYLELRTRQQNLMESLLPFFNKHLNSIIVTYFQHVLV